MTAALYKAVHHVHHPGRPFPARRALAARLVLVELRDKVSLARDRSNKTQYLGKTSNSSDDIGALVHNNDSASAETRLSIFQGVKVHSVWE